MSGGRDDFSKLGREVGSVEVKDIFSSTPIVEEDLWRGELGLEAELGSAPDAVRLS